MYFVYQEIADQMIIFTNQLPQLKELRLCLNQPKKLRFMFKSTKNE